MLTLLILLYCSEFKRLFHKSPNLGFYYLVCFACSLDRRISQSGKYPEAEK